MVEEAHVVFGEESEVFHAIFEVRDSFHAHAESVAFIFLAVNAVGFKYGGVHHAATKDFHPTGLFAEGATLSAADVAGDVHFCTGFGEGEVGGTETDLCAFAEEFASESEKYLLEVSETHVFVNVETFHLMEEAVCTSGDGFVSIDASRANHSNRGLCGLHHAALHGTGVCAEDDVRLACDEEGVLHVACGVVGGEVHGREDVPVVFDFRSVGKDEAQS